VCRKILAKSGEMTPPCCILLSSPQDSD
jgi:hypothetical protein